MRGKIVFASLVMATPAFAGFDSAYTDLNFKDRKQCTDLTPAPVEGEPNDGVAYECAGYGNYVVSFTEGDLRSAVAFGTETGDHCAASQSFSGFNSIGNRIEWRLKDGKPIATILRWTVSYDPDDSSKSKTWLVVTRLEDDNSCHMGYVEGSVPNANAKAREIADRRAAAFQCNTGKITIVAKPDTDLSEFPQGPACSRE